MLFCMEVRARAADEIVDSNILFFHLTMIKSAYFIYVHLEQGLWLRRQQAWSSARSFGWPAGRDGSDGTHGIF